MNKEKRRCIVPSSRATVKSSSIFWPRRLPLFLTWSTMIGKAHVPSCSVFLPWWNHTTGTSWRSGNLRSPILLNLQNWAPRSTWAVGRFFILDFCINQTNWIFYLNIHKWISMMNIAAICWSDYSFSAGFKNLITLLSTAILRFFFSKCSSTIPIIILILHIGMAGDRQHYTKRL